MAAPKNLLFRLGALINSQTHSRIAYKVNDMQTHVRSYHTHVQNYVHVQTTCFTHQYTHTCIHNNKHANIVHKHVQNERCCTMRQTSKQKSVHFHLILHTFGDLLSKCVQYQATPNVITITFVNLHTI